MSERLHILFLQYNWTLENLGMLVLGLFIVEMASVITRDSKPGEVRTKFSLGYWLSRPKNVLSPILTVTCSLAALAMMAYMCPAGVPPPMYAFGSGATGQALIKLALKRFGTTTGTDTDTTPTPTP